MKRALVSDIHGNLEALTAVLRDISLQDVDEVCCLGDIVGYGPNPCECLAQVMDMRFCILGNHDEAVFSKTDGLGEATLRAIVWTREQLRATANTTATRFLSALPRSLQKNKLMFVHGSPCDPTNDYVLRIDVHNEHKMEALFSRIDRYCFQGHTHCPGVFTRHQCIKPEDCDYRYLLGEDQLMINVGSVGQPRDGDPRACYAILTDKQVLFRRVEYPVDETVEKIHAITHLDDSFGDRLLVGE